MYGLGREVLIFISCGGRNQYCKCPTGTRGCEMSVQNQGLWASRPWWQKVGVFGAVVIAVTTWWFDYYQYKKTKNQDQSKQKSNSSRNADIRKNGGSNAGHAGRKATPDPMWNKAQQGDRSGALGRDARSIPPMSDAAKAVRNLEDIEKFANEP